MKLYEVLVPTIYGDTKKPIRTRHHKMWDAWVKKQTGGLTILTPAKGIWVHKGQDYVERVIPVRIFCDQVTIQKIVQFTLKHYRQKAVMYYLLSNECFIIHEESDDRCEHGMFFSGAGACPMCGGGATL